MGKDRWSNEEGNIGTFIADKYLQTLKLIKESSPDFVIRGARKGCNRCRNHPGLLGYDRENDMAVVCPCIFEKHVDYMVCFPWKRNRKQTRMLYRATHSRVIKNALTKQLNERKL